ncbi:hypothetical protein HUO13_22385 [Saccharopolyspora erythraea]|uniref:hypothetical protein n=1 Tax=Saccharopolyspora erythraea TaxID=1836 RepID=UPI001BA53F0D|nr:hypothetical protein [Saccharopolyspora erythraea]QUH03208.1 hypothetical protein HUO13_22385 [Saccharopolyspora erythraea]
MSNPRQDHITQALQALTTTADHHESPSDEQDMALGMSDLAVIADLLGRLAEQSRTDLASWGTVGPHLEQAQHHAQRLARSLRHATGTLAYNAGLQAAA